MSWTEKDLPDLSGKTVIVTGANSGIGFHTAKHLAAHGATVVMACRNTEAGQAAAAKIDGTTEVAELDLASLDSVRRFAESVDRPVDLLVNNAGVMYPPTYRETADGFELQYGTNHLGHVALTARLLPRLLEAPTPARGRGGVHRPPRGQRVGPGGQPRVVVRPAGGLREHQAGQHPVHPRAPAPGDGRERLEAHRHRRPPGRGGHQPGRVEGRDGCLRAGPVDRAGLDEDHLPVGAGRRPTRDVRRHEAEPGLLHPGTTWMDEWRGPPVGPAKAQPVRQRRRLAATLWDKSSTRLASLFL